MQFSDEFLERWEHIIDDVDPEDKVKTPVFVSEFIVVNELILSVELFQVGS